MFLSYLRIDGIVGELRDAYSNSGLTIDMPYIYQVQFSIYGEAGS